MDELLEKIDIIRIRMNVSYKEAKEALDNAGGDLVAALVALEAEKSSWSERLTDRGEEMLGRLKAYFEKGTAKKIRFKKGDRVLFELPASAGMLGLAGMLMSGELAVLGAVGTVTAMLNKCTLEFVDQDGTTTVAGEQPEGPHPTAGE